MDTFLALIQSSKFHLGLLALVAATAAQGLVAIWAATSRIHWFWRALAVWAAVTLLVPIRAYQPALVFAVASPLVIAIVALWRWIVRRTAPQNQDHSPTRLHFSLRDLLLAFALIGLALASLLAIARQVDEFNPSDFAKSVVAIALPTAFAYLLVADRPLWLGMVLLAAALLIASPSLASLSSLAGTFEALDIYYAPSANDRAEPLTALFVVELAGLIGSLTVLARMAFAPQPRTKWASAALGLSGVLALMAGVPLILLYGRMVVLAPFPDAPLSNPNHFDRLTEIAKQYSSSVVSADQRDKLRIELLTLLEAPNAVAFDPATDSTREYIVSSSAIAWGDLTRSLRAEGQAAAAQGDLDLANSLAMANLRLGLALQRGGLHIDSLFGLGVEGAGISQLTAIRGRLSPDQLQRAIGVLQACRGQHEPLATVAARDYAFTERAYGWQARLAHVIERFLREDAPTPAILNLRIRLDAYATLLLADLAIHRFRQSEGDWPDDLAALVPHYLPELPLDPYSGLPLHYRIDRGETAKSPPFVLYSIGQDRRDDGGRFGNSIQFWAETGYDLDLDTPSRP